MKALVTNKLSLAVERARRLSRIVEIAQRYQLGEKVQEIANEYDCSTGTVLRIARQFNLEKRPRRDSITKNKGLKLYKKGVPIKAIAKQCERSEAWVSKVAAEAGILRRQFAPRK